MLLWNLSMYYSLYVDLLSIYYNLIPVILQYVHFLFLRYIVFTDVI